MTPLQIQMLLWYWARPTPYAEHEPYHANSSAVHEQRQSLMNDGLLERDNAAYKVTLKGEAHVNALCALPYPVCTWMTPPPENKIHSSL